MKSFSRFRILLILLIPFIATCNKDDNHIEYINNQLYDLMRDWYFWYDEMPVPQPDPANYNDPQDYMDAITYAEVDKWSYIVTQEENQQYFEEGKSIGHGFSLGLDDANQIRIIFVYPGTEAAIKGVERGWILSKINGVTAPPNNSVFEMMGNNAVGVSNTYTFLDHEGLTKVVTLTKENYSIVPVLHSEVITLGSDKIGYMVFQDFINPATGGLDETLQSFVNAGINELVIDLRYNGGGMVSICQQFAGWLVGKTHANEVLVSFEFNNKHSSENVTLKVPSKTNGLDLDRVFFIGTQNTASASEMLINGLKPFVSDVILAGSNTHGKPVGMNGFQIDEYIAYPITFSYYNKNHEGDFFGGLVPDIAATDDFKHDFGDLNEPMLKSVLDYIDSGSALTPEAHISGKDGRMLNPNRPMSIFLKAN